jgi:hypothetical protein
MFKKIFLGTLIGYLISSIFLTVYRYLFGGWTNLFDGTMEAFKADYIFSNIGDYLFLTIGSLLFCLPIYLIIFKLLNLIFKQKTFNNTSMIFPIIYVLLFNIHLDIIANISPSGPGLTMYILMGIFFYFVVPILLNLLFLLRNKKNQN